MRHLLLLALCALALGGCAQRQMGSYSPPSALAQPAAPQHPTPKPVLVTIDGTSNTLTNRTNPGRLHELIESYSYQYPDRKIASFYAEGVGSGDAKLLGLLIGQGVNDDIKRSYSFLTQVWKPGDPLFFNGYSRGAYTVRALSGLIYIAGIPDLSGLPAQERKRTIDAIFDAYKTSVQKNETPLTHARRRTARIAKVMMKIEAEFRLNTPVERQGGFGNPASKTVITAMTIWDSVSALGAPDSTDDPLESHSRYLVTNCNVRHVFHALSLDDNRARSFTPIFAKGPKTLQDCANRQQSQHVNIGAEEVWFSGAHADVSGTYDFDFMLDGELPSVSLNWMLGRLETISPELFPKGLRLPENRISIVHKGDFIRKPKFSRSRKPSAYAKRAYGKVEPLALHASVADRMELLFALDGQDARCSGTGFAEGPGLLCAQQLASYSLVPELLSQGCLDVTDWGYRVVSNKGKAGCPRIIGQRRISNMAKSLANSGPCPIKSEPQTFTGWTFKGSLRDLVFDELEAKAIEIPFPHCVTAPLSAPSS